MDVRAPARRYPLPTAVTAAFVVALCVTAASFAGVVPGIPKTLPMFARLVGVTVVLFAVAAAAWTMALVGR